MNTNTYDQEVEEERLDHLDELIDELYGDNEEIDSSYCTRVDTKMLSVKCIRSIGCIFMDTLEDVELEWMQMPPRLIPLLREGDTFLVTFGLKGDTWTVLYLSPAYDVVTFDA